MYLRSHAEWNGNRGTGLTLGAPPSARINQEGRMVTSGFQNQDCPLMDCLVRLCVVIVVELADGERNTGNH
jgi:hypothetical protein